MNRIGPDVPVI